MGLFGSVARKIPLLVETLLKCLSSAVISFNSGKRGLFDVYRGCNLETGSYTELFCYLDDASKVCRQNIKSSVVTKKRRKTLRSIAKGYIDKETEEEPSHSSGAFCVKKPSKTAIFIATHLKNMLGIMCCLFIFNITFVIFVTNSPVLA